MTATTPNRSSPRRGRPLIGDARKVRHNVMLFPADVQFLTDLGDGNLSEGIARAAAMAWASPLSRRVRR